jgi:hypothetical protein
VEGADRSYNRGYTRAISEALEPGAGDHPSVELPVAAQDQEERKGEDGHQRADEPGGANDYV